MDTILGLTFVGVAAVLVVVLVPFLLFTLYKYCGFRFQFQKVNSILAKLLILNKTAESIPPTLAQPMTELGEMTLEMFDFKILQLVLIVMASTLTCYLLIRMTLWLFDYLNTKFLNINSTGLTYLSLLNMDRLIFICSSLISLQVNVQTYTWVQSLATLKTYIYVDNLLQVEFP